jgi:hypothetical protein
VGLVCVATGPIWMAHQHRFPYSVSHC